MHKRLLFSTSLGLLLTVAAQADYTPDEVWRLWRDGPDPASAGFVEILHDGWVYQYGDAGLAKGLPAGVEGPSDEGWEPSNGEPPAPGSMPTHTLWLRRSLPRVPYPDPLLLLGNDRVPHSLTFTPDAGRATARLGNTEDAYGQIWHLPTHPSPPTGQPFVEDVAAAFRVRPSYRVLGCRTLALAGLFSPTVRESIELLYQNDRPYLVDSTKFTQRFFAPTPYAEGIRRAGYCMLR